MKEQTPPIAANGAKRRSTRVAEVFHLIVTWPGNHSKTLVEETSTVSINCHGCQYLSRFHLKKNTKISLQVGAAEGNLSPGSQSFPARVAWIRKSRRLNGLYLVGVEFDTPKNLWLVEKAPEDWKSFSPMAREDSVSVSAEMERLLRFVHEGTHYQLLGVQADTPRPEVKRHFYHLASLFHPDHHMDHPEWTPRLLKLMDALTIAYKTLSDDELKKEYDSRLAGPPEQESYETNRLALECLEKAEDCLADKNYVGSILYLRQAIEVEPNSSLYRTMLGGSLAAVPEYRHEAVEQFEKAIDLDPANIAALFQYAELLEQLKFPRRARPLYQRVLELDRNHRQARAHLNRLDGSAPRAVSRTSLLERLTGRY